MEFNEITSTRYVVRLLGGLNAFFNEGLLVPMALKFIKGRVAVPSPEDEVEEDEVGGGTRGIPSNLKAGLDRLTLAGERVDGVDDKSE